MNEFAELIQTGYMTHPDDVAASHDFNDMCDDLEAKGMTPTEAITEASKHF